MQGKLVSALEKKEQLIHFRVYGKTATSVQRDGDGKLRTYRYTLVIIFALITPFSWP